MSSPSVEDATAQHVRRTLRALELLAAGPQTQADVARELSVHRRTARRLLARLAEEGYATPQTADRHVRFHATSRLAVLGRQVAGGLDLPAIARPHLAALEPQRVGARFLARLQDDALRLIHVEEPVGVDPRAAADLLGRGGPLHATAAGKVFLSADDGLLGEVLNQDLLAYTPNTMVTRGDLLLELATVRDRGYATEDEEHHAGVRVAASPVIDHVGRTVAALGAIPAPGATLTEIGALTVEAALATSRELGAAA